VNLRVLFVEDSPDDVELMLGRLRKAGIEPQWQRVETAAALRDALAAERWDLALVDYNLPGFSGPEALAVLAALAPDTPAITVSGAISEETAVATISAGAVDYVLKGNLTRLAPAVRRAVEGAELRRQEHRAAAQARQTQFAVDHSSQAIAYVGRDGTILYANAAAGRLVEATPMEVCGGTIWRWSPPGSQERWAGLLAAAVEHPPVHFETAMGTVGGKERVVSVTLDHPSAGSGEFVVVYARDVTAQRAVEERARESETLYRRIVEMASEGIWAVDERHVTTFVNPQMARMLGYEPDEMIGRVDSDFMFAEDLAKQQAQRQIRKKGLPGVYERRFRSKDGGELRISVSSVPELGPEGEFLGSFALCTDITESKRAEEALTHSRDLMRYIIEHNQSAVAVHDRDLKYIYVSQRYLHDYGVKEHDVIGKRHYEVFPDLPQKWRDVHQKALAGETSSADNDPYVRADGSVDWTRWECRPWYEADGSIGGIIVYTEVITARKRAEEELAQSHDLLANLARLVPGVVYQYRLYPDGRSAFPYSSPGMNDIYECTPEEVRQDATPVFGRLHPDDYDRVGDAIQESARTLDEFYCEFRVVLPRQGLRWRWSQAHPERMEDGGTLWHGIISDITARKQAEEELRFTRFVVERAGDAVFWMTSDGAFKYANPLTCETLGYSLDELCTMTIHDIDPNFPVERWPEHIRELEQAGSLTFETHHRAKGGTEIPMEVTAMYLEFDGDKYDVGFARDITARKQAEEEARRQAEQLRRTVEGAVLALSLVVETRDPYTAGHERRVSELATAIAVDMGIDGDALDALRLGGLIHDVGKVAVPAEILSKPGRLSEVELNLIKQHPQAGFDILQAIDFGLPVAEMVLQHHERLDGSGYPQGLAGEDVLPEARILAVADVVEAMSSHRPYRPALGMAAALAEVKEHAGVMYDAAVVATCVRLVEEQGFVFTP